ncbi:MAG: cytochrome c3 family protein, partial [Myxococcales bacterium]|nr:cytochrome c3 family protein [Myxococcales bacterium]
MSCHNGSNQNDYAGTGMSNPHPFGPATYILCTDCHGGNGGGLGRDDSHVPPPPEIGNELNLVNNQQSYFNYLTRTGLDKLGDYTGPNGETYTALDYIQFMNPGDVRIVAEQRGCGVSGCHDAEHADWVKKSPLGLDRFFTTTMFSIGLDNAVAANDGLYQNTAADYAWRRVDDPNWGGDTTTIGRVGTLYEIPTGLADYGDQTGIYNNPLYDSNALANYLYNDNVGGNYVNQVITGSPIVPLIQEAIVGNCADCHTGSSGANNRYADFRSSGCTSCHMEYSFDGKSRSTDPNVNKYEPFNPDAIAAPERSHIMDHQIRNVAKVLDNGAFVRGQSDKVCVGCHQGSNRTVLQFWGIRLDQNQDLVNGFQYPANPDNFINTANDTRLFDPAVNNNTFNGRNANQYILYEDYDADGLDDTPPDIHYESGMGCIDCHGSKDVHSGTEGDPNNGTVMSKQSQVVGVSCISCHGGDADYAETVSCTDYDGNDTTCASDRFGNPLRNVTVDPQGNYWLKSRVDGLVHYIPQTRDTIDVNGQKVNPITSTLLYDPVASYAMGRVDGLLGNGLGPRQTDPNLFTEGFSHMDNLSCEACHSSWTNSCIGCH